ncbi:Gfo/Idh/MocA family oxidoreductase, partial [Acinetobacter baumannii]
MLPGVTVTPDPLAAIARTDVDLVVIATPNASHAPLASAAIAAGKAVVVDKPMALDLAQSRTLVAQARAANVPLWVFHNRRWDSDFL